MKIILHFLLFSLPLYSVYSQVIFQETQARELNSNRKPLGGVFIKFESSGSSNSDANGIAKIAFQDKKPGEIVFLEEIVKSGYELVNEKDFELLKISNTDLFGVDIILAKKGVIDAAKKEYYNVSDEALKRSFYKEKNKLKEELKSAKIQQDEYLSQIKFLQDQYENQKENLDQLAEKFARTNFDDVSELYQRAFNLYKQGDIEGCKKELLGADLIGRTNKRLQERERIAKGIEELNLQDQSNESGITEDIKLIQLQVETHLKLFEIKEAESLYDQLLLLDSTNLEILIESSIFYRDQHIYEKAKKVYLLIINHPQAELKQIANIYEDLGQLYAETENQLKAKEAYDQFLSLSKQLYESNPSINDYKFILASAYQRNGDMYRDLGDLKTAKKYYELDLELMLDLFNNNPNKILFKEGLSISFGRQGRYHQIVENLDSTLYYFIKDLQLTEELVVDEPNNRHHLWNLAISHEQVGDIQFEMGNIDAALTSYKTGLILCDSIYKSDPTFIDNRSLYAHFYAIVGNTFLEIDEIETAKENLLSGLKMSSDLYDEFPENNLFKGELASFYNSLGYLYFLQEDFIKAQEHFEIHNKHCFELYMSDTSNFDFKEDLAISYNGIGMVFSSLGEYDVAFDYYKKDLSLSRELLKEKPQIIDLKYGLANTLSILGDFTSSKLKNDQQALIFFLEAVELWKELVDEIPHNQDYKNDLKQVEEYIKKLK